MGLCMSEKIEDLLEGSDKEDFKHYEENKIKEYSKLNHKILCLKIYIVGSGDKKEYIINNIFKNNITDEYLKKIADREFKTEQFHWIARIYKNDKLNDEDIEIIAKEIMSDRGNKNNINKLMKYQVIICFENDNVEILSKNFEELCKNRMIFITDSKCHLNEDMEKRYATNIIYNRMTNKELNIKLISTLWELDCCINERGNQICRYTPERIFNGLENDNSNFSINILLTGLSRTGKSTLINLLSGKMVALEGDDPKSVTNEISEYYIYRNDDKNEHGAIKIIDTPGIVPNKKNSKDIENKIINMIEEQDKTFENQIHFIFFVLMKGSISLEGENIAKLLQTLNNSKCIVYFIINKVSKNQKKMISITNPIINELNRLGCSKLASQENFISANFKKDDDINEINGIDKIFTKIKEHITKKNYLDINLKNKMKELLNNFRNIVNDDKIMFLQKGEKNVNNSHIQKKKLQINFDQNMKEIIDIIKTNSLLSKFKLNSLIENGKKIARQCRDVIISLSNLKELFPENSKNISMISIFQAYMVKEIALGYGLDIDSFNYGTDLLLYYMKNKLSSLNNLKIKQNDDNLDILDNKDIENSLEFIQSKLNNILKKNNKESIFALAELFDILKKNNQKNQIKSDNDKEYLLNKKFTYEVYYYCKNYFENELNESEGLIFLMNYFNKCELLLKDIDYYIEKSDWENYDIEIIS